MKSVARAVLPETRARDLLVADDEQRLSWPLMARPLGVLWIAGGSVVELWLALYGGHAAHPWAALVIALASQALGIGIGRTAQLAPPPWTEHAIILSATAAVSCLLWATHSVSSGLELIYLWPVPYAFILVRPRYAVVHVALVAVAWVVSIVASSDSRPEEGRWLVSLATLGALSLVTAHLVTNLRGSRQLLDRAFEDAPLGMAFMDTDGRWIALNTALRDMLGADRDELLGAPVADVLDPGEPAAQRPARGREHWVEVTRAPVHDGQGRIACWSLQVLDVTVRRAAELTLRADAEQARWADEVRAALREDRIVLYVQPLVALDEDRLTGHEVLARLVQADGTVVGPGAFMPAVERFGLAPEFDAHVLRRAVGIAACGRPLHVNLSARSIGRAEVIGALREALAETGADPSLLTVEITETALTDDVDALSAFGRELCGLGCRLSLDDFGTGYGTLTYLTSLPFTEIKIDRGFVAGLAADAASADVVRAVVGLARSLGTTTVAEGIEDEGTLALVRDLGVDVAQGYLLGRPRLMQGAEQLGDAV